MVFVVVVVLCLGKKKSQEAKNKAKKATDKKQKTVLDITPADMRDPKEGKDC